MGGNLLIKGGQIIDGTGAPQIKADVRIKNGVIVEIGPDLSAGEEDIYDAGGAFVVIPIRTQLCFGTQHLTQSLFTE